MSAPGNEAAIPRPCLERPELGVERMKPGVMQHPKMVCAKDSFEVDLTHEPLLEHPAQKMFLPVQIVGVCGKA